MLSMAVFQSPTPHPTRTSRTPRHRPLPRNTCSFTTGQGFGIEIWAFALLIFLLLRQLPSLPMLLPPSNPSVHHKKQQCLKQLRDISKSLSNGVQLRFWIRCSSTTCFFSVPTSSSSCFHIRSPKLRCTAECTGFWCPRYGRRSRVCYCRRARRRWFRRSCRPPADAAPYTSTTGPSASIVTTCSCCRLH